MADPVAPAEHRDSNFRLIVLGVLIALVVIFFLLNSKDVEINFIVGKATTSLFWALIISTLAGVVIGYLMAATRARARAKRKAAESE